MYRNLLNSVAWLPAIAWNTPGEPAAGGTPEPAPADPPSGAAAGGEGEGSPPAEGASAQSGESGAPGNLITGASQPDGEGGSGEGGEPNGEGGDASAPLTSENITLPEGFQVDDTAMEGFLGIMNNQELDRAQLAQALVDLQVEASQQAADAATTAGRDLWNNMQTEWQEQARALPDIGGDNLESTLGTIRDGMRQMGATDKTFEALNLTGAGNHPEIIRIMYALTKDLQEQPPVNGDAAGDGRKLSQAEIMYGGN